MDNRSSAVAVLGNINLDVVCKTVDDVPRYVSIVCEQGISLPGGCGSNVAIGLAKRGVDTLLLARTGDDFIADLLYKTWDQMGVDARKVQRDRGLPTGISVILVDSAAQPRFVHTPGANPSLRVGTEEIQFLLKKQVKYLHVAGYFVLPGLLNDPFGEFLGSVRDQGISVSLDVVSTPAMDQPGTLWACLPDLDLFLCNLQEARRLTGEEEMDRAADAFRDKGARTVVIKMGRNGCWATGEEGERLVPAPAVKDEIDTTGAGDAFAADLLTSLGGDDIVESCRQGNRVGADVVLHLGAVEV